MMAWFRALMERHIIGDDPDPQLSRLDIMDGLGRRADAELQ